MGPGYLFLCDSLLRELAQGHMSSSRSSPVALRWSACVDPFTSYAAAMRTLSPLKSPRQATVTNCKVSGEKAQLRTRGCCRSPAVGSKRGPQQLWLSGEVQRAVSEDRGGGDGGSHSNSI